MRIERTRNATRNIRFGVVLKIYQTVMPFLIRTLFIYIMGAEYLGLNSLFTSVLQVLNLAELGVGSALTYSMYKPIAEDDTEKICALMRLYKIYYRIIGAVILVAGLLIIPFLPYLVESDLPADVNLYVLYLLNLGNTVITYWLFAYKNSIITAHQRNDVTSKITLGITTLTYMGQLLVLFLTRNYYLYIIVSIVTGVLNNIVTAYIANKMYPQYIPRGTLPREERQIIDRKVRDLLTGKIGGTVTSSVDTIVISSFLGLISLAKYQNYYYIMNAVVGFVEIIFTACYSGIGNSIVVETKEKNFHDFRKMTFIIAWIIMFCVTCFLCLYQPFMEFWVGEEYLLDFPMVILFCIYFFCYEFNRLCSTYKNAAGMWHRDRFRPLISALLNLVLNILMVNFGWGLHGILISTIIAFGILGNPWLVHNIFHGIFESKYLVHYLEDWVLYTFATVGIAVLTYLICSIFSLSLLWTVIVNLLICMFLPNVLFFLLFFKTKNFKDTLEFVNRICKGKLNFLVSK